MSAAPAPLNNRPPNREPLTGTARSSSRPTCSPWPATPPQRRDGRRGRLLVPARATQRLRARHRSAAGTRARRRTRSPSPTGSRPRSTRRSPTSRACTLRHTASTGTEPAAAAETVLAWVRAQRAFAARFGSAPQGIDHDYGRTWGPAGDQRISLRNKPAPTPACCTRTTRPGTSTPSWPGPPAAPAAFTQAVATGPQWRSPTSRPWSPTGRPEPAPFRPSS